VRPDYRKYPSGSHVLFYRLTDDGIDVVRILHERMDYERHIPSALRVLPLP
jgi:toxin ParE1/3/4